MGDHITFTDCRGKKRALEVDEAGTTDAVVAHCSRRAVIDERTAFQFPDAATPPIPAALPEAPAAIRLHEGERLLLTRARPGPGRIPGSAE